MKPLFSIIIPVYKVEQYIRKSIDSVLSQSYQNWEMILVDDGSPDKCGDICDEYATKYNQIEVIHKYNGGLSSARNAGLNIAQGDYILFLDSDDWWDDVNALSKVAIRLAETNADVLIYGMKKFYMKDKRIGDIRTPSNQNCKTSGSPNQLIQQYMKQNIYVACAWDKVIRRSLIEDYKLRFVEGQLSEDIEWCAKLLLIHPNVQVLDVAFYVYRQGNLSSITSNITKKNVQHVYEVITKYAKNDTSEVLKHYLANQFILLLTFSNLVRYEQISEIIQGCKEYMWLLNYNWYPYVRKSSKVSWLGVMALRKLLGYYRSWKRIG